MIHNTYANDNVLRSSEDPVYARPGKGCVKAKGRGKASQCRVRHGLRHNDKTDRDTLIC